MMRVIIAILIVSISVSAADTPDANMGDWKGSMKTSDGKRDVVAQVIALNDGTYEARILNRFEESGRPFSTIPGKKVGDKVMFAGSVAKGSFTLLEEDKKTSMSFWAGSMKGKKFSCHQYSVTDDGAVSGSRGDSFEMKKVVRLSPELGRKAPKNAVVLLGKDTQNLDDWARIDHDKRPPSKWKLLENGVMEVHGGDSITKREFGSFKLHLEFKTPFMPWARGQGRGNSGVYIHGRYEVQVLDSYGLDPQWNDAGGIYSVAKPKLNMCAPPGQWQTYDIDFTAPEFDGDGKKTKNARITVLLNGTAIHEDLELPNHTGGSIKNNEVPRAGIKLQDHGNPVQYRNIWIVEK